MCISMLSEVQQLTKLLRVVVHAYTPFIPQERSSGLTQKLKQEITLDGLQTSPVFLETLPQLKELSREGHAKINGSDWRNIECRLDEKCNTQFETVADQMVIKVKQPFIQTYDRVEVFVNNDGLREYRIPLILENQSNNLLPQQMTEIVRWLNETTKKICVFY